MDEFPGNSNKQRRPSAEKKEPKKIEKIVEGDVRRRKKPLGKRLAEHFGGADAKSVWGFVALDVLLPAAKDAIADAVSQGVERMIFGEPRSRSRRTGRSGSEYGRIDYNRYSKDPRDRDRDRDHSQMSRRGRATHNFDEIILPTRGEAEAVIDQMFEIVSKYEEVKVADLYDMVGVEANYTDEKWGWSDIRGAGVTRIRDGYLLDLPRPEYLE